eukprot:CAMPEP_0172525776 /NCGR_PEP_ID=MMETSP1067-20121228/788_1 /TAXON_ID=265564 ORGANISM="Thalassiosira punctigera, Strain Tpunct2005C2" /NCGR_SAMPLE_ID=MMETSP1067 /ASSEMBLY_ACC=CAM_ASM_000444 /LENGTH=97 /DNA_ID=CAMNT_0013309119 /DNA_START=79 /DNA_END=372 /DNA_ORIENTATION=+
MFSVVKFFMAVLLLAQTALAFVPVTAGPSLDQKKGKIAGIGGIDGPKPVTIGGMGAVKVGGPKNKAAPKKVAAKKANKAKPAEKKKVDFFIKTPWSK